LKNSACKIICEKVLDHITKNKFDNVRIFCNAGGAIVEIEDYLKDDNEIDFESKWLSIVNGNIASLFIAANIVSKISRHVKQGNVLATSSVYGHCSPDFRIYQNSEYKSQPMNSSSAYTAGKAGVNEA
jgi:NAD(P)-dependent dehydrogenase (short-subunit alcohol dehydrogenase family)